MSGRPLCSWRSVGGPLVSKSKMNESEQTPADGAASAEAGAPEQPEAENNGQDDSVDASSFHVEQDAPPGLNYFVPENYKCIDA